MLKDINKLPFKVDMLRHTEWLIRTAMNCGADIRLNYRGVSGLVMAGKAGAIVLAVGAYPIKAPPSPAF